MNKVQLIAAMKDFPDDSEVVFWKGSTCKVEKVQLYAGVIWLDEETEEELT